MAHASVTVNLGQSAQNETLIGGGPNSSGLGTYAISLGPCTPSGGNSSCTLSGNFSGSTPGYTSGTYTLVTTYSGTGPSPIQGVQQSPGADLWTFTPLPQSLSITLNLTSATGTVSVPLVANGQFGTGVFIGFGFASSTCSGTPVSRCSTGPVGLVNGAVITGPEVGIATFIPASQSYYFSQLAFAGGWQITLTYVNYSPQTITCVTQFFSDSGSPLAIPFSSGTVSSRTDVLPAGQSFHDQTVANLNATVSQGWAQATCDGSIQASLLYRLYQGGVPVGEAGINAELAPTTEFVTFAQTVTGVAYANPSTTQSAAVTVTVIGSSGAKLASTVINLGPLAHGAANLGPLLGLQSFTGFVKITSTIPIISVSLNAEAFPVFSSLPAGDLPSTTVLVSP